MTQRKNKISHNVLVSVYAYRKAEGLPVQVALKPDLLDLGHCIEGDVTIQWDIKTIGYRFPVEGAIQFTSPGSSKVFGSTKLLGEGRSVAVRLSKFTGLSYAYSVTVIDESTGLTAVVDPTVWVPPR